MSGSSPSPPTADELAITALQQQVVTLQAAIAVLQADMLTGPSGWADNWVIPAATSTPSPSPIPNPPVPSPPPVPIPSPPGPVPTPPPPSPIPSPPPPSPPGPVPSPPPGPTLRPTFRILTDINLLGYTYENGPIDPTPTTTASLIASDGVWTIPLNSPAGIDWPTVLTTLNAANYCIAEDNPGDTSQIDFVSNAIGRMVDGGMEYIEDGLATPLPTTQIDAFAAHVVPGFGLLGARIVLLTRSYANGDPRQAELNASLADVNASGATFEFNPGQGAVSSLNIAAGVKYILRQNKQCYLLMPPSGNSTNYVSDIQATVQDLANSGGILNNPNVFLVPAIYGTGNVHFLNTSPSDTMSMQAAITWLKSYQMNPAPIPPSPPPAPPSPNPPPSPPPPSGPATAPSTFDDDAAPGGLTAV